MRRIASLVGMGVLLLNLVALSGCASAEAPQATQVAMAFAAAVGSGDVARACGMLSDQARTAAQPCERALKELTLPQGPVDSVQTWGDNAQVRMGASVMFLSNFAAGWRVTAAGCRPVGDHRYQCAIEG